MRNLILIVTMCVTILGSTRWVPAVAETQNFVDPLDAPAVKTPSPASEPLIAVTKFGSRLVAVGPRGLIITSDDMGCTWRQSSVPVQSDLVAVFFVDTKVGWASGHDGVILHTSDGGSTWTKQIDGIAARIMLEKFYQGQIKSGNANMQGDLQQVQANFDPGPILPWLGILFTDARTGYAVGSFGNLIHTQDGGQTWQPWLDHIDNPNFYDLNAIEKIGNVVYIAGEQGMVYAFDPALQKFVARPTGYLGSLFGLVGDANTLLAYGLRGVIYRSEDQGKSWTQSNNPSSASIMAGAELANGRIVLATVDGHLLLSDDHGSNFRAVDTLGNAQLTDVVPTIGRNFLTTSLGGIRLVPGT
jgi:photosystem II stability/assembly factor-like uncharacterized protein